MRKKTTPKTAGMSIRAEAKVVVALSVRLPFQPKYNLKDSQQLNANKTNNSIAKFQVGSGRTENNSTVQHINNA